MRGPNDVNNVVTIYTHTHTHTCKRHDTIIDILCDGSLIHVDIIRTGGPMGVTAQLSVMRCVVCTHCLHNYYLYYKITTSITTIAKPAEHSSMGQEQLWF